MRYQQRRGLSWPMVALVGVLVAVAAWAYQSGAFADLVGGEEGEGEQVENADYRVSVLSVNLRNDLFEVTPRQITLGVPQETWKGWNSPTPLEDMRSRFPWWGELTASRDATLDSYALDYDGRYTYAYRAFRASVDILNLSATQTLASAYWKVDVAALVGGVWYQAHVPGVLRVQRLRVGEENTHVTFSAEVPPDTVEVRFTITYQEPGSTAYRSTIAYPY